MGLQSYSGFPPHNEIAYLKNFLGSASIGLALKTNVSLKEGALIQLDELLNDAGNIRFLLPFTHFEAPSLFGSVDDYLEYKANVMEFIQLINERIKTLNP